MNYGCLKGKCCDTHYYTESCACVYVCVWWHRTAALCRFALPIFPMTQSALWGQRAPSAALSVGQRSNRGFVCISFVGDRGRPGSVRCCLCMCKNTFTFKYMHIDVQRCPTVNVRVYVCSLSLDVERSEWVAKLTHFKLLFTSSKCNLRIKTLV